MKMNPEVKELWCNALESGEFKQGRGSLQPNPGYFCCLGVLCELYRRETDGGWWVQDMFYTDGERGMGTPPEDVLKWAGLSFGGNPIVMIDGERGGVATHNDGGYSRRTPAKSFSEIAAAIREQL